MMLFTISEANAATQQQQPFPPKRRRGRPPKDQTVGNSPLELSGGIFTTSPLALNSAAALKVGSPEATSPLMRVSPDKRKRNMSDKVTRTGPKGKRSKSLHSEYTPTKSSPLSSRKKESGSIIPMIPSTSKSHQRLAEVTGKKLKEQQQQQLQSPAELSNKSFKNPFLTPNPNKYQMEDNLLLSSPLANMQRPSSFVKQHDDKSEITFNQGEPLTPASQFTSIIHSSPVYQNYFNESITPGKKLFNFETTFGKFDENFNPLPSNGRTNSLTIIDTIGRNISNNFKNEQNDPMSPFRQLVSSPIRPDEYIKKSFSTTTLPIAIQTSKTNPTKSTKQTRRSFKLSLKIGKDGKASIAREEKIEELDENVYLTNNLIRATPRQTIRPSLMTLSSSPHLAQKGNNTLISTNINGDLDSESDEDEDDEIIAINTGDSDARNALMRAFQQMI